MSGLGTCPRCEKRGFTRRGSTVCTRCEARAAKADAVVLSTPCGPVEMSTAHLDESQPVAVAIVETTAVVVVDADAVETFDAPHLPRPYRRPRKNYVKMMGRLIALDEDE